MRMLVVSAIFSVAGLGWIAWVNATEQRAAWRRRRELDRRLDEYLRDQGVA